MDSKTPASPSIACKGQSTDMLNKSGWTNTKNFLIICLLEYAKKGLSGTKQKNSGCCENLKENL